MPLLMYARRHGWPLEHVKVELNHERGQAQDDQGHGRRAETIRRSIQLLGDLSADLAHEARGDRSKVSGA